jgi:hypothetical protein
MKAVLAAVEVGLSVKECHREWWDDPDFEESRFDNGPSCQEIVLEGSTHPIVVGSCRLLDLSDVSVSSGVMEGNTLETIDDIVLDDVFRFCSNSLNEPQFGLFEGQYFLCLTSNSRTFKAVGEVVFMDELGLPMFGHIVRLEWGCQERVSLTLPCSLSAEREYRLIHVSQLEDNVIDPSDNPAAYSIIRGLPSSGCL